MVEFQVGEANRRERAFMDRGECSSGRSPEDFYPRKGSNAKRAKARCRACPVTAECLAYIMATEQGHRAGIWGNTTPRERSAMAMAAAAPV